jgi:hypothetical protein
MGNSLLVDCSAKFISVEHRYSVMMCCLPHLAFTANTELRNGKGNFNNITVRRVQIETMYPTGTNWWGSGEPIWVTNIPSHEFEGAPGSLGTIANVSFEDVAIESENGVLYAQHSLKMALIRLDFWLAWFALMFLAWFALMLLAWFASKWFAWFECM